MQVHDTHTPWAGWRHDPRDWQDEARTLALEAIEDRKSGIVSAVMGAGKSAVIAELCISLQLADAEHIVITTPTVQLVEQLTDDIAQRISRRHIGQWYTHDKRMAPIIVACMPSATHLGETLQAQGKDCALWIADEAHKTECDTIHEAHESLDPHAQIGFTATPFRAESHERLTLWQTLLYEYTPQDAIDDGVVVPPKLRTYDGHDGDAEDVDEACLEMIQKAVTDGEGPGMVNALTIDGAEGFAELLKVAEVRAEAVHSKRTASDNRSTIEQLKDGALDCVVHVNQLAEGTNLPWLRWLCLRRPVTSRTRFCQEVGRVLRTHPGKEYGLLLDPDDLFEEFGLSYEAVLAGGADGADRQDLEAADDVEDACEKIREDGAGETTDHGTPFRALEPARAWLRKTKLALQSVGAIEQKISSTHWRDDAPSQKQIDALEYAQKGIDAMPAAHQQAARVAVRIGELGDWTKGETSDLLNILIAVKEDGWPIEADTLIEQRKVTT